MEQIPENYAEGTFLKMRYLSKIKGLSHIITCFDVDATLKADTAWYAINEYLKKDEFSVKNLIKKQMQK